MRLTIHRKLGMLLVASAILLGSQHSRADELLVMPYSCRMVGGTPVLKPSREQQGHPVIGRREQRTFRACSPVNPDRCQRWTVHRFDLDCDGQRVPWVEVAAAAAEAVRGDGVFLTGDQIEIEMPPQWSLPPGTPCGRYREGDAERFGSFDRFCEERLARARPIMVAMPRGFAPMFGIDGIFVADSSPRIAEAAPPFARERVEPPESMLTPQHEVEPAPEPRFERRGPQDELGASIPAPARKAAPPAPEPRVVEKKKGPQKEAAAPSRARAPEAAPAPVPESRVAEKQERQKEAGGPMPAPAPKAGPVPEPEPRVVEKQEAPKAGPESKPEPIKPAPSAAGDVAGGGRPIIPQIINGQNPTAAPPQPSAPESDLAATDTLPKATEDVSVSDPPTPEAHRVETGSLGPLVASGRLPALDDPTVIAVAALGMLSLLTVAFLWRRGRASAVPAISRDIAAVSLEKTAVPENSTPTLSALPVVTAPATGRDLEPSLDAPPGPPATLGDAIPRTRAEALSVLGMGIGPDVHEAAIKKMVDGLRASWHPDRARDAADRATRELRLKQINAAWDILAGGAPDNI